MAVFDLTDAIDLHVHTAPDVYERRVDDHELVRAAEALGMRALLLKSHHTITADRATLAGKGSRVHVFGGLALNHPVGGLNPIAVETAIDFGAKQIWMPTLHAAHCLAVAEPEMFAAERRKGRLGLTVLDGDGELRPVVRSILELVRDADIILGTGHLAPTESLRLLREAKAMGLTKLLVTPPLMSFTYFEVDQMRAATELGAVLEFDYLSCSPKWHAAVSPEATAAAIRAVGPEHCVLATDGGQTYNPPPPRMLQDFGLALSRLGFDRAELRLMMCEQPARLLGL